VFIDLLSPLLWFELFDRNWTLLRSPIDRLDVTSFVEADSEGPSRSGDCDLFTAAGITVVAPPFLS